MPTFHHLLPCFVCESCLSLASRSACLGLLLCCQKISCDTLYILNCLAGKITKWHRWAIAEIWLLSRSLVSPRTRVLVTCSETERTDHAWALWEPLRLGLILQFVLGGHNLVRGFLTILYLCHVMPCFTFCCLAGGRLLFCCSEELVYFLYCLGARRLCYLTMPSHTFGPLCFLSRRRKP